MVTDWSKGASWQLFDHDGKRKYVTAAQRRAFLCTAQGMAPEITALAYVLAYTGCRLSEALELSRHQVDVDRMEITLRSLKKRRLVYRVVPVPKIVVDAICALPRNAGSERIWTWHRTTGWRRIKLVMAAAGIDGPASSPKGLRHGFGNRAAEMNILPGLTQRWLGHADLRMTMIYSSAVGSEERAFAARMW